MAREKRTRGRGFRRSPRQWEETVSSHLGKFIDRIEPIDALITLGAAYMGYEYNKDLSGAIFGAISYKLARAPGGTPPISQIAGITGLTLIGASLAAPEIKEGIQDVFNDLYQSKGLINAPYPNIPKSDIYWKMPWEACKEGWIQPRPFSTRCIRKEAWEKKRGES